MKEKSFEVRDEKGRLIAYYCPLLRRQIGLGYCYEISNTQLPLDAEDRKIKRNSQVCHRCRHFDKDGEE